MPEWFELLHWGALFQIIAVDILLGGDNAVVIALACRNLPKQQRLNGIIWGTVGAIAIRLALIAFALSLLDLPYLKIIGGVLLLWIGIKLLDGQHDDTTTVKASGSLWAAIKTIIIADLVMSLDNVMAIAGAASNAHIDHQMYYVAFGLIVSVPIIIWGSTLVLRLIDRFPWVVTLGAGLLGWIAGGMLVSDVAVPAFIADITSGKWVSSPDGTTDNMSVVLSFKLAVELIFAILVVIIGKWWFSPRRKNNISSTMKE